MSVHKFSRRLPDEDLSFAWPQVVGKTAAEQVIVDVAKAVALLILAALTGAAFLGVLWIAAHAAVWVVERF